MKISEYKIRKMVKEAIDSITNNNDDPMKRLAMLLSEFTYEELNLNYGSQNDWSEICESIGDLYEKAKLKEECDRKNIGKQYRQALSQGRGDEVFDSITSDYYSVDIEEYLLNIDKWDKYLPSSSEVKQLSDYFIEWLEEHFDYEITDYRKMKEGELEGCRSILNKKVY